MGMLYSAPRALKMLARLPRIVVAERSARIMSNVGSTESYMQPGRISRDLRRLSSAPLRQCVISTASPDAAADRLVRFAPCICMCTGVSTIVVQQHHGDTVSLSPVTNVASERHHGFQRRPPVTSA